MLDVIPICWRVIQGITSTKNSWQPHQNKPSRASLCIYYMTYYTTCSSYTYLYVGKWISSCVQLHNISIAFTFHPLSMYTRSYRCFIYLLIAAWIKSSIAFSLYVFHMLNDLHIKSPVLIMWHNKLCFGINIAIKQTKRNIVYISWISDWSRFSLIIYTLYVI